MKRLTLVMLIFLASVLSHAQASDVGTTEDLLGMCKSDRSTAGYGYCLGFISGMAAVMEQVGLGAKGDFRSNFGMCAAPPYPTPNAEVQAVVTWAQKNSQFSAKPDAVGVAVALAFAWPCSDQR